MIKKAKHQGANIVIIETWTLEISKEFIDKSVAFYKKVRRCSELPIDVWFLTKDYCYKCK